MDVVMRNLQVSDQFKGPAQAARHIYAAHGIAGFYAGLGPQLGKAVPYCCAAWASYDYMKRVLHFEVR